MITKKKTIQRKPEKLGPFSSFGIEYRKILGTKKETNQKLLHLVAGNNYIKIFGSVIVFDFCVLCMVHFKRHCWSQC